MALPQADVDQITTHVKNKMANDQSFAQSKTYALVQRCIDATKPLPTAEEFSALVKARQYTEVGKHKMSIFLLRALVPGVDETADPLVSYRCFKFRGDADALLEAARTAYRDVRQAAHWCEVHVSSLAAMGQGVATTDQAWALKQYKTYFDGGVNKTRLEKVKSIFSKANHAINKEHFEIICEADYGMQEHVIYGGDKQDRIHAFVRKSEGFNRIYLSSMFFAPSDHAFRGAGTLMHEMSHLVKIGDTEDEIKIDATKEGCLELAAKSPDLACNNAENYGLFAMKVLSKLKKGAL